MENTERETRKKPETSGGRNMNIGDLPATLFSPAKLVYLGFLVLVGLHRISLRPSVYVIVSLLFIVVEIWHNDYYRIVLNGKAEAKKKRYLGH